jgi:hypothetical protein
MREGVKRPAWRRRAWRCHELTNTEVAGSSTIILKLRVRRRVAAHPVNRPASSRTAGRPSIVSRGSAASAASSIGPRPSCPRHRFTFASVPPPAVASVHTVFASPATRKPAMRICFAGRSSQPAGVS